MPPFEKLKWQCRRGTAELDVLLLNYLETGYLQADRDEQARFVELLAWEDDELLAALLGGKAVVDPGFAALVAKLNRFSVVEGPKDNTCFNNMLRGLRRLTE